MTYRHYVYVIDTHYVRVQHPVSRKPMATRNPPDVGGATGEQGAGCRVQERAMPQPGVAAEVARRADGASSRVAKTPASALTGAGSAAGWGGEPVSR